MGEKGLELSSLYVCVLFEKKMKKLPASSMADALNRVMRTKRALAVSRMKVVHTTAMTTLRRLRSLGVNTSSTVDDDDELLALLSVDPSTAATPTALSSPAKSLHFWLLEQVWCDGEIKWCWWPPPPPLVLLTKTTVDAAVGLLRSVQIMAGASEKATRLFFVNGRVLSTIKSLFLLLTTIWQSFGVVSGPLSSWCRKQLVFVVVVVFVEGGSNESATVLCCLC